MWTSVKSVLMSDKWFTGFFLINLLFCFIPPHGWLTLVNVIAVVLTGTVLTLNVLEDYKERNQ